MQIHGTTTPSAIRLRGTPLASTPPSASVRNALTNTSSFLDDHSEPTPVIASCISASNRHFAAASFSVASFARILANNRFPVFTKSTPSSNGAPSSCALHPALQILTAAPSSSTPQPVVATRLRYVSIAIAICKHSYSTTSFCQSKSNRKISSSLSMSPD